MNWKWLIPTACLILGISPSYGQGQSRDSIIINIRSLFQSINSDTSLRTIELSEEEFIDVSEGGTDGGASLKGYFKGDSLVKMHLWVGLSSCVRKYDYYFANGRPFFIYETEEDFPEDTSGSFDYTRVQPAFSGRYYLDKGKVADMIVKGRKRAYDMPTKSYVIKLIADSKDYAKSLRMHFKKPRPALAKPA